MNRRRADTVVGVLVGLVLLTGGTLSWRAYQQRRAVDQSMGPMMGSMHGPDPLWYVLGTLLVAVAIGGLYLLVREELTGPEEAESVKPVDVEAASPDAPEPRGGGAGAATPESEPQARVLDLLPDDERRVLEPVLDSPGITQIELRDRSEFSKSKVSQTVSALEERGLLYRERQGRTYRIYPSDDLRQQQSEQ